MYKIFKHHKLPCILCLGETHIKLQWYNIFPQLFFLFLILQRTFFPLWLRHQTSATKLRYLRSSAFYRQPVTSGVFKGRRARHLPRPPMFGGPSLGVTRVNFPYIWWKTYYPLIWCTTKQIISKYSAFKDPPTETNL